MSKPTRLMPLIALFWLLAAACGSDTPPCVDGSVLCGDVCVNPRSDNRNCGECGTICQPGSVCNGNSVCSLSCQEGLEQCSGICTDTRTDRASCGSCGRTCSDGEVCDTGACVRTCSAGRVACGGGCIDPDTDELYCGATGDCQAASAGQECATGFSCENGACLLACQSGLVDCAGECTDPDTDRAHCGASGNCEGPNAGDACDPGEICNGNGACALSCQTGLLDCGGDCTDPLTDRENCGASGDCAGANDGVTCLPGTLCNGMGQCALSCQQGLTACNDRCTDLLTDRRNCGLCGRTCQNGFVCNGVGQCALSCQMGTTNCSGTCTNTATDQLNCGACGNACAPGRACNGSGQCVVQCPMGQSVCNGQCSNRNIDRNNCGMCGLVCDAGFVCDGAGQCALSCQAGLTACTGVCTNLDSDNENCGMCGRECPAGQACNGDGACELTCPPPLVPIGNSCAQPVVTYTMSGNFIVPAGVNSVTVLVVGGGGGGGSGHQGGGGSGRVAAATVNVQPGQNIPVTVGAGGQGAAQCNGCNELNGNTAGGPSSFGNLLTAAGGGTPVQVNGPAGSGGSGGGGACNAGSPGGNGGSNGSNGIGCTHQPGGGQGDFAPHFQLFGGVATAGNFGAGGNSSHSGGGGGGGVLLEGMGPTAQSGPQAFSARGGVGYGAGGGAGGYDGSSSIRWAGGNGAAGVVHVVF